MTSNLQSSLSTNGVISLSSFSKGAKEGLNSFLILQAKYDQMILKTGEPKDVISFQIELTNLEDPTCKETLSNFIIFVDYTNNSQFHQIIRSASMALGSTEMITVNEFIGLKGTVVLSYRKPEGTDVAYPRLNTWTFYMPPAKATADLARYAEELAEDANIMEWEDSQ
jgi:hypothetical protein